ncbi:MAG: hypothetical protein PHD48_02820 [Alphaproteobacteria bacterium]|nr:hypothetical protein [Alphaproteobacteria bacterium]
MDVFKSTAQPDLAVIPSAGYDTDGYPLEIQIDVARMAAAKSSTKQIILAQALGLPNRYQHQNCPMRVTLVGQKYQVDRSALITSHMFALAQVPADITTVSVPTPDGGIVQRAHGRSTQSPYRETSTEVQYRLFALYDS